MTEIKSNSTIQTQTLASVPTIGQTGCSNFGAMAINGQKAWALKTNSDNNKSNLIVYNNVAQSYNSYKTFNNTFGHGNGMTSTTNYLYVACWPQSSTVVRIKKSDLTIDKTYSTTSPVTAISYYGNSKFIVHPSSGDDSTHLYYEIVEASGTSMIMRDSFYVDINHYLLDGYNIGQDIYYHKSLNWLLIPRCKRNSNNQILENMIIAVTLGNSYTMYNNCKCYSIVDLFPVIKSSPYTKYEVESLGVDSSGYIIMACNIEGYGHDSFQKITNFALG